MVTIRARSAWRFAIGICLLLVLAGCSREQQDWRAAEGADTIEAYGHFIQRHPDSELVSQARTRVAQLGEDRDWQHAGSADTVDAYHEFLEQHPNGKWAQEARIRMQNFSLSEQAGTDAGTRSAAGTATAGTQGAPRVAAPGTVGAPRGTASAGTATSGGLAMPGEAAVPLASRGPPHQPSPPVASAEGSAGAGTGTGSAPSHPSPQPSAPPAAPPSGGGSEGSFGIQLGAFSSEASASNQWRALTTRFSSELQGLHEHVVTATSPSGSIYRLQADVGPEQKARTICESLRKQGQACVAVLPH
jgi:cell division septation protein DedD